MNSKGRLGLFVAAAIAVIMAYFYLLTRLSDPTKPVFGSDVGRFFGLYFFPLLLTALVGMIFHIWQEGPRCRFFGVLFCIAAPVLCLLAFAYISCATSACI